VVGGALGALALGALAVAPRVQARGGESDASGGWSASQPAVPDPRVEKLKALLDADVSSPAMYDLGQQMNDMIFSFGEIGFQEVETQKYLGALLRDNGFTVEDGVAGIPTAWVARWGSGSPVIAFGSDIDGIPQGSRNPASPITIRWSRAHRDTAKATTPAPPSTSSRRWR
jgi:aminobenzoyl-glutamate utilization protein B